MLKRVPQLKLNLNALAGRALNPRLDNLARAEIHVFHKAWSAFHVCGLVALALALTSALALAKARGLSVTVMMIIIIAVPFTVCSLAMSIKIVTGEEQYAQYHHAVAITAVTTLLLWLLDQPVLPYLDITIFGIGLALSIGRIGCFMVGCCYGRPSDWGVCYREEHADAGFAPCYVGVRLFPVQLIEALWTLLILALCAFWFRRAEPAGAFLSWFVVTYCAGRFWIEFLRGGPARPYLFGYSEAQWLSFLLMCLVVGLEYAGRLPQSAWQAIATGSIGMAMLAIVWKRSLQSPLARKLFSPRHVQEVAEAVEFVTERATVVSSRVQWSFVADQSNEREISIASTSLGIQLSASKIKSTGDESYHYAFSHCDGGLTGDTARLLAQLISTLRRARNSAEMQPGGNGVFHLFIHSHGGSGVGNL